jgi:hypothetical protein
MGLPVNQVGEKMGESRDGNLDRELAEVEHGHRQQCWSGAPLRWGGELVGQGESGGEVTGMEEVTRTLKGDTGARCIKSVAREKGRAAAAGWSRGAACYVSETRFHAVDARA